MEASKNIHKVCKNLLLFKDSLFCFCFQFPVPSLFFVFDESLLRACDPKRKNLRPKLESKLYSSSKLQRVYETDRAFA